MQAIFWTVEEVAQRAKQFYENRIRQEVKHGDNIGKMIALMLRLASMNLMKVVWNQH